MENCIIIDTSSILFAASNRKDIFEAVRENFPGFTMVISEGIVRELSNHSNAGGKTAGSAGLALMIIDKTAGMQIEKSTGYVDDWIVREWKKRRCIVCTNDIKLKKRLREIGASVLSVTRAGILR